MRSSPDRKKVCLINPPLFNWSNSASTIIGAPPLGLAYLAASIEDEFEIHVIDGYGEQLDRLVPLNDKKTLYLNGLTLNEIISKIPQDTLVVGISCMFTSAWNLHKLLIKKIRALYPTLPIVLGGEHITAVFEDVLLDLKDENIFCILGEGEESLREFAQYLDNKANHTHQDLKNIKGVAFLEKPDLVWSTRRERIKELDSIKWPAWHYFPMEKYVTRGITYLTRRTIPMLTSRGCPYRCKFCSAPSTWGVETYLRKPQQIVDEIEFYVKTYAVEHIDFFDLVGVVNKRWTLELTDLLIKKKLGVTFSLAPGTRSEILDKETLLALKNAGIIRLLYAPDSGSSAEAKKIKKFINFDKLVSSLQDCIKLGIPSRVVTIIGFPGQTYKELMTTVLFMVKCTVLGANDIFINNYIPYSGTEFYDELRKKKGNYQLKDFTTATIGHVDSFSENIPSWILSLVRIVVMAFCMGLQYLLRPWRLYLSVMRLLRGSPITLTENYIFLKIHHRKNFKVEDFVINYNLNEQNLTS